MNNAAALMVQKHHPRCNVTDFHAEVRSLTQSFHKLRIGETRALSCRPNLRGIHASTQIFKQRSAQDVSLLSALLAFPTFALAQEPPAPPPAPSGDAQAVPAPPPPATRSHERRVETCGRSEFAEPTGAHARHERAATARTAERQCGAGATATVSTSSGCERQRATGPPPNGYPSNGQPNYGPPPAYGPQNQGGYNQGPPPQGYPQQQPAYNQQPVPATLTVARGYISNGRINQLLSSDRNQVGDAFSATLLKPLVVNGVVVAEPGQTIGGHVAEVQKAGHISGLARLGVQLTDLTLVDGQQIPIKSSLVSRTGPSSVGQDAGRLRARLRWVRLLEPRLRGERCCDRRRFGCSARHYWCVSDARSSKHSVS